MNNLSKIISKSLQENNSFIFYKDKKYSYIEVYKLATELKNKYIENKIKVIGISGGNSIDWIISDLAAIFSNITCVPIPYFFNEEQKLHLINDAKIDHIIENGLLIKTELTSKKSNYSKITYTSGTTGNPKGVCLSSNNIYETVNSLNKVINININSHINILPYSTLLENIAGIYLPLIRGANIYSYPLEDLGFNGSTDIDINKMHSLLQKIKPESMIMVPELIRTLYLTYNENFNYLESFKFISVGGGKINENILKNINRKFNNVYEGYGLSECCSVVSLNNPIHNKIGTSGKPLPHISIEIIDNEIVVSGNSMQGYLGDNKKTSKIYTGDLGYVDKDGYLVIYGRKKNTIVTGFGRKVSPEWIESFFYSLPYIKNCLVYGNENIPITIKVNLIDFKFKDKFIEDLNKINEKLPTYAQIINFEFEDLKKYIINGKIKRVI